MLPPENVEFCVLCFLRVYCVFCECIVFSAHVFSFLRVHLFSENIVCFLRRYCVFVSVLCFLCMCFVLFSASVFGKCILFDLYGTSYKSDGKGR